MELGGRLTAQLLTGTAREPKVLPAPQEEWDKLVLPADETTSGNDGANNVNINVLPPLAEQY